MRISLLGASCLLFYTVFVLAPLLALWASPLPPKGGWIADLAIALGFAGYGMVALQFPLTARLQALTSPFGIDLVYHFHRWLAWLLCGLVAAHVAALLWLDPSLWGRLHPFTGEWRLQSGALALLGLALLMVSSVLRKRVRLAYQHWRRLHLLFALLALACSFAHLHAVGYYSSPPSVLGLCIGMLGVACALVVYVHLLRPWRLYRKPWALREIRRERGDCWTLTLGPVGHAGLDFQPGQFAWLSLGHTPFGLQEHPFSFASAPRADRCVEFTIKELGDFTRSLERFSPGERAWVDGPYGLFTPARYPAAPGYVFVGGGIGIAPIVSMLQSLVAESDRRPHMLFAAHSRFDRIPRRDEIVALVRQLNLRAVPILEEPPDGWDGERGWITRAMLARYLGPEHLGHHFFLCGPKPMTDAVERFLYELGVPSAQVHTELFAMA